MIQNKIIDSNGKFVLDYSQEDHRNKAISVMLEFYDYMSEYLTLFPMFGTLLGIFRNDDLIPHDGDIDFGYFLNEQTQLVSALENIHNKSGFLVIRNQFNDLFSVGKDGVLIDLYRYDDHGTDSISQGSRQPYSLLRNELHPLSEIDFRGSKMTCMADPIAFFTRYYGEDWKTPKNFRE
jgi:phosphorylcholine metabolism protein LicD